MLNTRRRSVRKEPIRASSGEAVSQRCLHAWRQSTVTMSCTDTLGRRNKSRCGVHTQEGKARGNRLQCSVHRSSELPTHIGCRGSCQPSHNEAAPYSHVLIQRSLCSAYTNPNPLEHVQLLYSACASDTVKPGLLILPRACYQPNLR